MNRHRSLDFHLGLVADSVRTESYREALSQSVREGDVVADIGAGTGILSIFAVRAGARKVYAIERTGMIEAAREVIRKNGMEQEIDLIYGDSRKVHLPEKVDLVLTELISEWGVEEEIGRVLEDARCRFLKKGGRLIPEKLETFLAPVENDAFYREIDFWGREHYGIDFTSLRDYSLNRPYSARLEHRHLLAEPERVLSVNFYKDAADPLEFASVFRSDRAGFLHGFSGWFKADLTGRVRLTTEPPAEPSSWRNPFFPLSTPLRVTEGDRISVKISEVPCKGGILWEWSGAVGDREKEKRFHQGTLVNMIQYRKTRKG